MQELLLKLLFAFLPIPFFFLIYFNYFKKDTLWSEHVEAFFYGILLAAFLVIVKINFKEFFENSNPIFNGFLGAAVPEKLGSFFLIHFFLKQRKTTLTVLQGTVMSMMFGLGFAGVENIIYASTSSSSIILVRFISAVPLHVFSNGILGFFLSVSMLCTPSLQKKRYFLLALFVPLLIHGFFDAALFSGGFHAFFIAPLIVFMNGLLVYLLARSETLPGMRWLSRQQIRYSDWMALDREPQYERWIMRSSGIRQSEKVKFISWSLSLKNLILFLLTGIIIFALSPLRDLIYELLLSNLTAEEFWTLVAGLPTSYLISMLSSGMINPEYFKTSMIKIPIISDVDFWTKKETFSAITYDITDNNTLLKTVDFLPVDTELTLVFSFDRYRSPEISGRVVWESHDEYSPSSGVIVRFDSVPDGFKSFLFRYYLFKISRGLSYNLRLPGFEGIRKFFIRPLTLMQNEKRCSEGDVIFNEGQEGKHFYLIKKGTVGIFKNINSNQKVQINTLGPGDIFGEMAIAGKQKRSASAMCQTDCILAVANGENLDALIKGNPEFTHKIIQELARRIFQSETLMKKELDGVKSDLGHLEKTLQLVLLSALYELKLVKAGKTGLFFSRKKAIFSLLKKYNIALPSENLKKVLTDPGHMRSFA
ncbi:MAG: cyclic nucleotide-binding domain-containing protein, partial [Spirochaetia bacterium]|nr:cyclic nucleotide-binding domain-containing protein [Spirochaetia bacterium]